MESRTVFYECGNGTARHDADWWLLVESDDGSIAVEHRWRRPGWDGMLSRRSGVRRLAVESFFREEGSDTAKRRLRRLLDARG